MADFRTVTAEYERNPGWDVCEDLSGGLCLEGRVSAISATTRKHSVIIWNMVVKGVPYNNPKWYFFIDQKENLELWREYRNKLINLHELHIDMIFQTPNNQRFLKTLVIML